MLVQRYAREQVWKCTKLTEQNTIHQECYNQLPKSILYYKKELLLTPESEARSGYWCFNGFCERSRTISLDSAKKSNGIWPENPGEVSFRLLKTQKLDNSWWDHRVIEIIIREIMPLKMHKVEEGAAEVDRTIGTAAAKVKADHMASVLVTLLRHPMSSSHYHLLQISKLQLSDKQKDHQKHADQSESSAWTQARQRGLIIIT